MGFFDCVEENTIFENSNEITPSPADNSLYDTGLDKFADGGSKTYDNAMKSILSSSERMPTGDIKSIVKSD